MDKEKLAELIYEAKGERTIREYASDANISPSIISRILSNSYQPGIKVLQRLVCKEAKPQGSVTLSDLLMAAGFSNDVANSLEKIDEDQSMNNASEECVDIKQRKFKAIGWEIITDYLSSIGLNWQPHTNAELTDIVTYPDKYVTIQDEVNWEWWFVFWKNDKTKTFDEVAISLMGRFIINPPDRYRKTTLVVDDSTIFDDFSTIKNKTSYYGNYSIMLVDSENMTMIKEKEISSYVE